MLAIHSQLSVFIIQAVVELPKSEPGNFHKCFGFLIDMHSHRLLEIFELSWHRKNFGQLFY